MGAQHPRNVGREETLSGPDPVGGAAIIGWWPFCTSDEFDQYRAKHPKLELLPPYDFGALEHANEAEPTDRGGVSQGPLPYISDLGIWLFASNFFLFLCSHGSRQGEGPLFPIVGKGQGQTLAEEAARPSFVQ